MRLGLVFGLRVDKVYQRGIGADLGIDGTDLGIDDALGEVLDSQEVAPGHANLGSGSAKDETMVARNIRWEGCYLQPGWVLALDLLGDHIYVKCQQLRLGKEWEPPWGRCIC